VNASPTPRPTVWSEPSYSFWRCRPSGPLPLVNVIPGAVIILIAIAYLQEDGLLLAVAAAAAFLSLAGFGCSTCVARFQAQL